MKRNKLLTERLVLMKEDTNVKSKHPLSDFIAEYVLNGIKQNVSDALDEYFKSSKEDDDS
jgi:hypothetical protein